MPDDANPCRSCGACCAAFRVSFYWAEPVPEALTARMDPYRAVMRGTEAHPVRCVALDGAVGDAVSCRIYDDRPSPCREVVLQSPQCDAARARWGLAPVGWDVAAPPLLHPEPSDRPKTGSGPRSPRSGT